MTFSAPELLVAAHDTSAFDCGVPALDEWLKRRALVNQTSGASRTYVVAREQIVVGYYALAAGNVAHTEAPGRVRRNMPDPIPMMVLGRLAIDRSLQGQGLGHGLLKDVVLRVVQAGHIVGIRGILVDAIDDSACAFYEKYGFRRSAALPLKLMITLEEVQRVLAGSTGRA